MPTENVGKLRHCWWPASLALLIQCFGDPVQLSAQAAEHHFRIGVIGIADVSDSDITSGVGVTGDARILRAVWAHADLAASVSGISGLWWGSLGADWVPTSSGLTPLVGGGLAVVGDFDLPLSQSEAGALARTGVRYTSHNFSGEALFRIIYHGTALKQIVASVAIPL